MLNRKWEDAHNCRSCRGEWYLACEAVDIFGFNFMVLALMSLVKTKKQVMDNVQPKHEN